MKIVMKSLSVLALAALVLAGCASPQPSETPEAHGILRDTFVCFVNDSRIPLTITWDQKVNSFDGEGKLLPGKKFCGEGVGTSAKLRFPAGFTTYVVSQNAPLMEPHLLFKSEDNDKTYASAFYSENETVNSDVEGHSISAQRLEDNEWINFEIRILN